MEICLLLFRACFLLSLRLNLEDRGDISYDILVAFHLTKLRYIPENRTLDFYDY
jgi:hypothetical protein